MSEAVIKFKDFPIQPTPAVLAIARWDIKLLHFKSLRGFDAGMGSALYFLDSNNLERL